jgi:hypothetical protein
MSRPAQTEATFAAGTLVTSDYLPWARVLADSFGEHHPGVRFVVVVLDEPDPALLRPDDRFELLRPADIGLEGAEYGWMRAIYDGFELSCAVKPWLLRHLLTGADAALYLDGDILVCDGLGDIAQRAAQTGLVLTPHSLAPPTAANRQPDEDNFLRLGQFNAGFVAVGQEGLPFLDWWADRLRRECIAPTEHEPLRFVDQRWLDLVVNYFPLHVLRDAGANVAYWNVAARPLQDGPGGYTVCGQPLRFMHFSGFEPANPQSLSKHSTHMDAPGPTVLRRLCADYAARLADAGLQIGAGGRLTPTLADGIPLTAPVRSALRWALMEAERLGTVPLPDPSDVNALMTWLRAPVTAGGVSWYLWGLRASHLAVRTAFPHVPGHDEARYLAWSSQDGATAGLVPGALAGPASPVVLDGARSFVALVSADEILADPSLLAGIADNFTAADDVTLVVHAPGAAEDAFAAALMPALTAAGLDGADALDVLGLLLPAASYAIVPHVHAVLTRRPVDPALALVPVATDAGSLRALAGANVLTATG